MDGYARGPFAVDWEERIDFTRLRNDRVQAVKNAVRASGLDAVLVWKDENVRYLASLRAQLIAGKMAALNGVLMTADAGPILFCSGGEVDKATAGMPWLEGIHVVPIMEQAELVEGFVAGTLAPLLKDLGVAAGRLGMDEVNFALIDAIKTRLPDLQLVDGDSLMQSVRIVKTPDEIAVIEEACAIADSVTQRAIDGSRAGRRECEVAGDAVQTLFHMGGELPHVLTPFFASGEHMSPPHRICTDKIVRNGDLCFVDIGAMWNGYYADIGRTTIVGRPTKLQKQIYTAVYECLMAGIAEMRPGNTNSKVAARMIDTVRDHGFGEHMFSLFIGHGIGIGANEPPYIGETLPGSTEVELKPGMVFAVEPLVWVPGVRGGGGVRIEDMILITEGDPHVLSRVEYEERLLD